METILIPDKPSIGVVIGTKGATAHIHMHLETWKRHYPEVPLLVHDDCSEQIRDLHTLCCDYGADFSFNSVEHGHVVGDLTIFWHGLLWAKAKGLDLLVKFSRRFIPLEDFRPSLVALAVESQYATYSNECIAHRFGFRTESMAMHVPTWLSQHQLKDFRRRCIQKDTYLPEKYFHDWSKNIHPSCKACIEYEKAHPPKHQGYGAWEWLGHSRRHKYTTHLWHESARLREYAGQAYQWGLMYEPRQFQV